MEKFSAYVEHANICVESPEETIRFLLAAIPDWRVRGQGEMDWFGALSHWFHVGNDATYIAIQSGSSGKCGNWQDVWTGVKHIGIVVDDMDAVIRNLQAAGFAIDHYGGDHPFRKNVYFLENHGIQFEFIEYLSTSNTEKNLYV
ncbi:MAG: lactoylglutathione lyase [Cellvibrio sp. 79]|nr:MAG: lactoylglutathione lyase [Cellvibrio sp. 79]